MLGPTYPLSPAIRHVFILLRIPGRTLSAVEFSLSSRFEDSVDVLPIGRNAAMDEVKEAVLGMKDSVKTL